MILRAFEGGLDGEYGDSGLARMTGVMGVDCFAMGNLMNEEGEHTPGAKAHPDGCS